MTDRETNTTTSIEMHGGDAALILRADGTFDLSLPAVQNDAVPENIVTCAALAFAVQDVDLCKIIFTKFAESCYPTAILATDRRAANTDIKVVT